MSQADWKLRAATSTLAVAMTIADSGQKATSRQITTLSGTPHFQPSFLAMGLPSSTRFGVAIHVLKKSMPRENTSRARNKKYSRLAKGTVLSINQSREEKDGIAAHRRGGWFWRSAFCLLHLVW